METISRILLRIVRNMPQQPQHGHSDDLHTTDLKPILHAISNRPEMQEPAVEMPSPPGSSGSTTIAGSLCEEFASITGEGDAPPNVKFDGDLRGFMLAHSMQEAGRMRK